MKLKTLIIVGLTALAFSTGTATAITQDKSTDVITITGDDSSDGRMQAKRGDDSGSIQANKVEDWIRTTRTKVIKYINKNTKGNKRKTRTSNPGGVRGFAPVDMSLDYTLNSMSAMDGEFTSPVTHEPTAGACHWVIDYVCTTTKGNTRPFCKRAKKWICP